MNPGTVLLFKDFVFEDGTKKDKLLIILNSPKIEAGEPYLVCTTTSKQHRKKKVFGCHAEENYYYIDEKHDKFLLDTWIVFDNIYQLSATQVLRESFQGKLTEKFQIESTLWTAIRNCILKSKDIYSEHLEMISRG